MIQYSARFLAYQAVERKKNLISQTRALSAYTNIVQLRSVVPKDNYRGSTHRKQYHL